jgi:hypothetical protein
MVARRSYLLAENYERGELERREQKWIIVVFINPRYREFCAVYIEMRNPR